MRDACARLTIMQLSTYGNGNGNASGISQEEDPPLLSKVGAIVSIVLLYLGKSQIPSQL